MIKLSTRLTLALTLFSCWLCLASTEVVAHPLDELGNTPYQAEAPDALDVAIALEKDGRVEVGFFIDLKSLLESEYASTQLQTQVTQAPEQPLSEAALDFAQAHIFSLIELYTAEELQAGDLSFRELKDSGVLPTDGKVWTQISYPQIASASDLILVLNEGIQTIRVGIIDAVDSTQSRLISVEATTSHAVLIRGDVIPDTLTNRPAALKQKLTASVSMLQTILNYTKLGFVHIVPKGLDHILFVLALFLLSTRLRVLVIQISIFTIAHTLTLALASMELVQLPASIVEPLIALSIAYVALENCAHDGLKRSRMFVIFVFGLLHGLGFAGVLAELGLSSQHFYTSLLSFNVGVELGQLSVVLLAAVLLRWTQSYPWYGDRVMKPISILIALTGLFWGVERLMS